MSFVHMSGAGNTFIVGSIEAHLPVLTPESVRALIAGSPRPDGRAVEGVLCLRSVEANTFVADYYNPDGSYGMMCGNGSRCIIRYALDHGLVPTDAKVTFTLNGRSYTGMLHADDTISVDFAPPTEEQAYPVGMLQGIEEPFHYVNVGSDHVVSDGPRDADRPIVQALRHHEHFARGVNVNMVDVSSGGAVMLSTFERGVEAITGACGTGAIATTIALWRQGRTPETLTILPPSGRPLTVIIHHTNGTSTGCTLRGDAHYDLLTLETPQ